MKKEKIMEKENGKTYLYSVVENNANKYFKKELNSVDDEHIQMLNNELHKWNLLKKYPFVANICYFDNDKQHYIMYEYIEGENLADYKFKDVKEKLEVLASIANKLYIIHQLFLVHGDLKPTNIMITPNKEIYIIDFATSKYVGETIGYGTKKYCSINQLNKEKANIYFDIYALGIIMYELLTDKKAYLGMNDKEMMDLKNNTDLSIINDNSAMPLEVEKVFVKMINNEYANMLEIKNDLLSLLSLV